MTRFDDIFRLPQLDFAARRVFVRADLNVPISKAGTIVSDLALVRLAPILKALANAGCKVVVGAHYGSEGSPRPPWVTNIVARRLTELVVAPVTVLGRDFPTQVAALGEGQIALTPNLLSYPEEVANDSAWAGRIARSVDVYVSEDLPAARFPWASVTTLPRALPAHGVGPILFEELAWTKDMVELPTHPFTVVLGDNYLSRPLDAWGALLERIDTLLLGGEAATPFLVAIGWSPGSTPVSFDDVEAARRVLALAQVADVDVRLPSDFLLKVRSLAPATAERFIERPRLDLAETETVLDIGSETQAEYRAVLAKVDTVVVAGLMGSCERTEASKGSREVLSAALETASYSLVIGEKTLQKLEDLELVQFVRYRAGWAEASFDLLCGLPFAGLEALRS